MKGYHPPDYFLDLARSCMGRRDPNATWGTNRSIISNTDSVLVVNSAVCIQKTKTRSSLIDPESARNYLMERSLYYLMACYDVHNI